VHDAGSSVVIEACELGSEDFVFIRIAHLSSLAVHLDSPRYQLGPEAAPAPAGGGRGGGLADRALRRVPHGAEGLRGEVLSARVRASQRSRALG
jgi:hypothetical protein